MIHAVHYEPQGQRQRFELREQQGNDLEQSLPLYILPSSPGGIFLIDRKSVV